LTCWASFADNALPSGDCYVHVIDEVLAVNRAFAQTFSLGPVPPVPKFAVVACMDARIPMERALGLQPGTAHIIRNAGGIVTDDVLRSLIVSHHAFGTKELMIINHTGCGMLTIRDQEFGDALEARTGFRPETPASFHGFSELESNVREQVRRAKSHPWIPNIPIRGFVYDVMTGLLREVNE
jgi:carbonic anhydrase